MINGYPELSDADIVEARPGKNRVDSRRPYACLCEPEHSASGDMVQVATIFLTNRECPFRCLMCDLWQNTTDDSVAEGMIPAQIDAALAELPDASHIKLYNSGNFFDRKAIPPSDYPAIARRLRRFDRVIVENHPRLCTSEVLRFRDLLEGQLEIAMGLETVHPDILQRLNKRMTLDDFERSTRFLIENGVAVRAFVLLKPPFMNEQEGIDWALRSLEWAFDRGVACCAVIPTRPGNGMLDRLMASGHFSRPTIRSMERVLEVGLALRRGRVFMDLWDVEPFFECPTCGPKRSARLESMNLTQQIAEPIACGCA